MNSYSLIVCIVRQDAGELVTESAANEGATGGTILKGRGTASSGILQVLGLGDTSKDIVYILVPTEIKNKIVAAIINKTATQRSHFGTLFTVDISQVLKTGEMKGGKTMEEDKKYRMITIILNKGFADDAMEAARRAGAGGGTIVNARGTAREGDEKFFGVRIVPEKEMLMILVESDKADSVFEAIRNLPCLAEPGSGISFCFGVDDFTRLGGCAR